MKWTIGIKIGGGFALALAALVIIELVAYRSTRGLIETAAMVEHTNKVLETLDHDGKRFDKGDTVDMKDDKAAQVLIDRNVIEAPEKDEKPAAAPAV